jgi:arylsulfatase A-like enzyme
MRLSPRRRRARLARAGAALAGLALAACTPARPDIVLVTFDTLRADHVGAYAARPAGSLTPRLDAVAERARVFEHAFTTMPTTAPAHASLLTGLHPREHGIERNGDRAAPEHASRSLQQRLRDAGYATGAFVTAPVFGDAMGLGGFDRWDTPRDGTRAGAEAVQAALAWLDGAPAPVFLWVHLYDPHAPYGDAGRKGRAVEPDKYGWVDGSLYASPEARDAMAELYALGVRDADAALGLLLDGLTERRREPFLVVAADHGELLAEQLDAEGFAYGHGALLTREVLHVPLLLAGPGVEPGRVSAPASLRDVYPTLLGVAGLRDGEAVAGGRFDLRGPLPGERVVVASRRIFDAKDRARRKLAPKIMARIQAHAVAASDGSGLVVLGLDGSPLPGHPESGPLHDAALAALEAEVAARAARKPRELDEGTRARLRALGYVE